MCACCVVLAAAQVTNTNGREAVVCVTTPAMAFRNRPALGGRLSFISEENVTLPFVVGTTFQPFFIETTDLPDGTLVSADVIPTPVLLTGAAVELVASQAVFDAFSIADNLPINETTGTWVDSWIIFTAKVPGSTELVVKLLTGKLQPLNATTATAPSYARLLHYGALRHETPADVPNGVAMGDFYVGVFDRLSRLMAVDATVSVAIAAGKTGTLQPVGATFRGRGAVKLSGLTFATAPGDQNATAIAFTVRTDAGWSTDFISPDLDPRAAGASNDFFEFDPELSFVREDNAGTTAVLGVTFPPIVVRLMTSTREADASNTGLVVRAATSRGQIIGGMALVVRGVATFADLAFSGDVAPTAAVISFSVTPSEGRTLSLRSGDISVARTVIHAKHLVWAPWSEVTATAPARATVESAAGLVRLPSVSVRMLDSAFGVDPEAGPIPVSLTPDPPGLLEAVAWNTSTIRQGSATFLAPAFRLASGVTAPVTVRFKVRDATPGLENARSELTSADVIVDYESRVASPRSAAGITVMTPSCVVATPRSARCELSIRFDADETTKRTALYAEDGAIAATLKSPLAMIRVRLYDLSGPYLRPSAAVMAAAPILLAHTSDDPLNEVNLDTDGGANRASLGHDGAYAFACLRFTVAPSTLVRVRFTAVDPKVGVLAALSLRSGFVRIVNVPTSDFALRFGETATGIINPSPPVSRPLQRSTAVVGVTLPPIAIEVVDSLGVLDTGRDTIPVTIVASTPDSAAVLLAAEGTSVTVKQGVAIFDQLRFTTRADDVRIRFRAFTTTGETTVSPVVGSVVWTGAFTVTIAPHPLSHIELGTAAAPVSTGAPQVVSDFGREIVFANMTDVAVTTVIKFKDSAHRPITGASHARSTSLHHGVLAGMVIRTYSDEFNLEMSTSSYDASCACFVVTVRPQAWISVAAVGQPAYVHHQVVGVGPEADPALLGARVSIGPITVTAALQSGGGGTTTCRAGTSSASAFAEFQQPLRAFDAALISSQIAHVMAVEVDRITVDTTAVVSIDRREHDTLEAWSGVKVPVAFTDPRPGDRNRDPSASLVTALINMNGDCVAPELKLKVAYDQKSDQSCIPADFTQQAATARQCMVSGASTPCACYATELMGDAGRRCVREQQEELQQICLEMSTCTDAQILAVCDQVPVTTRNLTGLYVSAGALAVVMLAGVLNYRRKLRQREAERRTLGG